MTRLPSLRSSFLLLLAAVFLPLVLVSIGLVAYQWDQSREGALADLREQARVLRYAMDRELTLDIAVLNVLAASRDLDTGDLHNFNDLARRTTQVRPGSWVVLVDSTGQNTLNTALAFGAPLPDLRRSLAQPATVEWEGRRLPLPALETFEGPLRTGRPAFSGVVYGEISNRPVVATNVPVLREGRPTHVLGMAYGFDFFVGLVQAQVSGPQHVGVILDGSGRLVARNRAAERFVGLPGPAPFERGAGHLAQEAVGESINLEGEPSYFAYSRSGVNDWVAIVSIPKSALLAPARQALWASAAFILAMAGIGSAVALGLSRRIAAPLAALAQRAQSGGSTFEDVPASGIEDVEALRRALVQAAAAQQERTRMEDERERTRQDLERAHGRLLESDRRKDEYLLMLGHELRNPLAAIGTAASVLAGDERREHVRARMAEIVVRQTRHLARLVDDLLDVARVTHGKMTLRRARVALHDLVRRIADDMVPLMQRKQLRFDVRVPQPVWIDADEVRIVQVLTNLLDNAVKYTPEGGRIELALGRDGDQAVLSVRDSGRGIPRELLPRIFDAFIQNAQTIERSQGGLGLGLAVVKGIVDLHGGTIEASSDGDAQGAEFLVRLPAAEPAA